MDFWLAVVTFCRYLHFNRIVRARFIHFDRCIAQITSAWSGLLDSCVREFKSIWNFDEMNQQMWRGLMTSKWVYSLESSSIKAFWTDILNGKGEFVRFDGVQRIQHRSARIVHDLAVNMSINVRTNRHDKRRQTFLLARHPQDLLTRWEGMDHLWPNFKIWMM